MQQRLMEYHIWATERLLQAIEQLTAVQFNRQVESSFPSIRETLVHMLVVDHIWLGQVGISVAGLDLAEVQTLAEPAAVRSVWERLAPALHEAAAAFHRNGRFTAPVVHHRANSCRVVTMILGGFVHALLRC